MVSLELLNARAIRHATAVLYCTLAQTKGQGCKAVQQVGSYQIFIFGKAGNAVGP
jgi:hypothetical protein